MKTILVVDDESSVRDLIEQMLIMETYSIKKASNGREAMDILNQQDVDLVVTDMVMPEENGIDLIMNLKKQQPDVPIIGISGGGGIEGRFDYLKIAKLVGAARILRKPFNAQELRNLVKDVLK